MKAPVVAALLALAACGAPPAAVTKTAPDPCVAAAGGALKVERAWVRAQSDASGMSAAYFRLCNAGPEPVTIQGMTTPAAALVELHETTRDGAGVVSMAPTGPITLAPGEAVVFEPGGKHAMLMSLSAPIAEGSTLPLTLELSTGEFVDAEATVKSAVEAAGHAH